MFKTICFGICVITVSYATPSLCEADGSNAAGQLTTRPSEGRSASENQKADIEKTVQAYEQGFNQHDVEALTALWAIDGVYEDHDSGEVLEGRKAIRADLEDLFKRNPNIHVDVHIDRVHFIGTNTAKVNGTATIENAEDESGSSRFSAIYVRQDEKWLLDNVDETTAPTAMTAHEALQQLAWLVGDWRDESEDIRVETSTRWSRTGTFLIRKYTVQVGDEEPREGTHVIGWDPKSNQFRSWIFDGDGSFGEGIWSRSGEEWLVRVNYVSEDGSSSSATQVITRVDDAHIRVQMIAREIDGDPVPSSEPIMVARVSTDETTDEGK